MKKTILIFSFLIFIISCKKNNDPGPTRSSLIARTWLLKSITFSPALTVSIYGSSTQLTDATLLLKDCTKDDLYTFNLNKTFIVDEGATKCNSSDPQTKAKGMWSLSIDSNSSNKTDSTLLKFNYNTVNISGKITDLSTANLQITTDAANLATAFVSSSASFYIDPKSTSVATVTFTAK